jgi:hypothetical protein
VWLFRAQFVRLFFLLFYLFIFILAAYAISLSLGSFL